VLATAEAPALFAWLRSLSFVEQGAEGLFPHDLAREVLDADLRWRDPEGFRELHGRLLRHLLRRVRARTGTAQQRAYFDVVYLSRNSPLMRPYYDWKSMGTAYSELATEEGVPAILAMVRRHEGEDLWRAQSQLATSEAARQPGSGAAGPEARAGEGGRGYLREPLSELGGAAGRLVGHPASLAVRARAVSDRHDVSHHRRLGGGRGRPLYARCTRDAPVAGGAVRGEEAAGRDAGRAYNWAVTTTWDPIARTLRTALGGTATVADVEGWRQGLERTLAEIPDNSTFKLLFDLRGYEPADLDAHRAMRGVVPALLASHGLRPAVLDLFDERSDLPLGAARGIEVTAFANVHHDSAKMDEYERRIARPNQRFFADREAAERWLAELP
jgi:hypothetical protein